jgi:hypothetical protein
LLLEGDRTWAGLHAAMQRVGKDPEPLFSWLQDLVVRNIKSDADIDTVHFEMNAFHLQHAAARHGTGLDQPVRPMRPGEPYELLPIRRSDVLEIQRLVRDCFESLRTKAFYDLPPVQLGLHWNKPTKGGDGMVLTTIVGDGKAAFLVSLRALLTDVRFQLRECSASAAISGGASKCERLFLAGRVTQMYCSRRCGNRAAQAQYRSKHSDQLPEKRHEQYKKQVRKRHPRAKVTRRRGR